MSLLSSPLSAEPIRWDENGHYYEIVAVPGGITWWEAQQAAVARGGHLVTIQSAAENDFVFQNLASNPAYWQLGLGAPYQNQAAGPWIGAFQPPHAPAPNAEWQWVNGDGSLEETYANWLHAEPNGDGGTVGGVALFYDNNINDPPMITSQWNDWQATNRAPSYIIEWEIGLSMFPRTGGNSGLVTATIRGVDLGNTTNISLVRQGEAPIYPLNFEYAASTNSLGVVFDLSGKRPGTWSILLEKADGSQITMPSEFTIEEGGTPQLWVKIVGRPVIRAGGPRAYTVVYGNTGIVDAVGASLWIGGIPSNAKVEVLALQQDDELSKPIDVDGQIVVSLVLPKVAAGEVGQQQIVITTNDLNSSFDLKAAIHKLDVLKEVELIAQCLEDILLTTFDEVTGAGCVRTAIEDFSSEIAKEVHPPTVWWGRWIAKVVIGCVPVAFPEFNLLRLVAKLASSALSGVAILDSCTKACGLVSYDDLEITVVFSDDPNAKAGPAGSLPNGFVSGLSPTPYTVEFENVTSASAPAQDVVIVDQLDAQKLDLNAFSFAPIWFGGKYIYPVPNRHEITADVDLRPAENLIVRIWAYLNPKTGLLTWRLTSVDPTTGRPPDDPLAGFLPPNKNPPEGQGGALFTVMPKAGLPTGTKICNKATITFDTNAPIETNEWCNTIDNSLPVSQVATLAATQTNSTFPVHWSGTDVGSGIKEYTIYASENGGPFTVWLSNTTATSGNFTGQGGKTYAFYSVARDQAGNLEEAKIAPEATTQIVADTTPPVITPTISGTLGSNGWYTSNVTVSWAVVDNESSITTQSGCDTTTVTTDTSGVTFTCSATSSGGTASKSVTVQRDATPPTLTGSVSPAANAKGWSNSAVTVSFTCNDATSGIATCTAPQILGEGANQSVSGTATDKAGNPASTQVMGINIDLTAPLVSVTGVTNGATYTLGSVPAAGCTTTDALSGVQASATLSVTGGGSNGVGTFTASCTGATDKAGNTGAASVTYQVNAPPPSAFSAFSVNPLVIDRHLKTFFLLSKFTVGKDSNGINPVQDTVTLTIANFTTTIPAGSFHKGPAGVYAFAGKINNVSIEALITPLGSNRFGFQAAAYGVDLSGTKNPVTVRLTIGDDSGTTLGNALIK